MAVVKKKDLRMMGEGELKEKKQELEAELSREKGAIASGTRAENPGKIREMRRTIARINTILNERNRSKLGSKSKTKSKKRRGEKK